MIFTLTNFNKIITLLSTCLIIMCTSCGEEENINPQCKITWPIDEQEFLVGKLINIIVDARDSDGIITNVEFYLNNVKIGSSNNPPFLMELNTTELSAGEYSIKVTTIDDKSAIVFDEISITLQEIRKPCPGLPTITYDGQLYNTILIGKQCWLRENLNVGVMVNNYEQQSNNGIIEKYCYENYSSNCDLYGGLYEWEEMMKFDTTEGIQGICPPNWHIPSDEEWKILEGAVDSKYFADDEEWDLINHRGYDAGDRLKSVDGWNYNGGSNFYHFFALPGGYHSGGNWFDDLGTYSNFWSSTQLDDDRAWNRLLYASRSRITRYGKFKHQGFSVRCIKD